MRIDWSVRDLRTRMNVQRRRRCTFILSPVLSQRDTTLETRHPPTADPVRMCNSVQGGRRVRMGGLLRVPCRRGAGRLQRVLVAGTPISLVAGGCGGWCRGVGPPRRAGAREGGGRRRVHGAVRCGSESLSRGGVEAVLPQGRTVRRHLPGPLPGTVPPGGEYPGTGGL